MALICSGRQTERFSVHRKVQALCAENSLVVVAVSCYARAVARRQKVYQLLITLRGSPNQATQDFRDRILKLDGVSGATQVEFDPQDPELPPYFFVYVETNVAKDVVIKESQNTSLVESVEEPPLRYLAAGNKAVGQKRTVGVSRRLLNV